MGKILHLITDEKFTDNVIENFESVYNNNVFFILKDENSKPLCKTKNFNIIIGTEKLFSVENVDSEVNAVVVHGLNYIFSKLILQLDSKIKVAWFAWGFDVYKLPKFINRLYGPLTLDYLNQYDSKFRVTNKIKKHRFLRSLYYKYIKKSDDFYSIYEKAHKKIDFFCSYIKEDFDLFIKYYPNKLIYQEIGYFTIKQYLSGQIDLKITSTASNVLIGNSNTTENNHLDVFDFLYKQDFKKILIVPLSYGVDNNYKTVTVEKGKVLFGENFVPLLDFMDREAYLTMLSNCSIAIFYHFRQQAMGNILALLYMGVRVYLSEKNPVYHYLKRIGIVVFNLDTDFVVYTNTILESKDKELNCKILDGLFNENLIQIQYFNLIDKLNVYR